MKIGQKLYGILNTETLELVHSSMSRDGLIEILYKPQVFSKLTKPFLINNKQIVLDLLSNMELKNYKCSFKLDQKYKAVEVNLQVGII